MKVTASSIGVLSWGLKLLSPLALLHWIALGAAAAQPGVWYPLNGPAAGHSTGNSAAYGRSGRDVLNPSSEWPTQARGYLGLPSRTRTGTSSGLLSVGEDGFETRASNENGPKATQTAGKAERKAGEAPSRFKDPTPRYPADPEPSEPSLIGDFRICPTMNHASCHAPNFTKLNRKHGPLDGKTIVMAPGRHMKLKLKQAKNVTILCEPAAWFGQGQSERIGGGVSMSFVNADGIHVEGCHFQRRSRGISMRDTVTATIKNNSFSNHGMHIQAHSAQNNPNNALGTGRILIADNLFFGTQGKGTYSHGLYLSGGLGGTCEIVGNRMLRFSSLGNGLKLGCAKGLVEDNQVLMLDGSGSVALDIVKGGQWVVRDNVFQSGPNRDNSNMASLAVAGRRNRGGVWEPEDHDIQFQNNTWILDGGEKKGCVLKGRSPGPIAFDGDRLVGFRSTCGKASDVLGVNVLWADVSQPRPALKDGEPLLEAANVVGLKRFETRDQAGLRSYLDQAQFADHEQPSDAN